MTTTTWMHYDGHDHDYSDEDNDEHSHDHCDGDDRDCYCVTTITMIGDMNPMGTNTGPNLSQTDTQVYATTLLWRDQGQEATCWTMLVGSSRVHGRDKSDADIPSYHDEIFMVSSPSRGLRAMDKS